MSGGGANGAPRPPRRSPPPLCGGHSGLALEGAKERAPRAEQLNGTTGTIGFGTPIALQAGSGHYAKVQNGGGPGDLFFYANSTAIAAWETFTARSKNW